MITKLNMELPIGAFEVLGYSEFMEWYSGSEKETKKWFFENIKPKWNIIDAGANIGIYSILFSKLAFDGFIACFEPTDSINLLSSNIKSNNLSNVKLYNLALGSNEGRIEETIFKLWGCPNGIEHAMFDFTTIDSFCNKENINPDLIKIDVDSYDYEVLLGSKSTLINQSPIVMVELNSALSFRGYCPDLAVKFMNSVNYELVSIFDGENYLFKKRYDDDFHLLDK